MNRANFSDPDFMKEELAFEGVVSEAEYQTLLKEKWFNLTTPLDFHGFNNYPDFWPFWSSEPYTYVTTMLALAKYTNTYN